ncbi:MAG: hypothetical protein OH319_02665 [Candidatus Parvarchaeota archaeon]|nr:hypothetical protein [Candidatus Jingweiarchaeum tengchongense]MCW1298271.1 hypothetical protein [Candidatus Jingweiarchaeum tengchongense]MCW1300362.1 hypothetical protein [Candidatus Jingweiarchaeum tengchongense]MCW1304793.1 hypothetical protein [Candidatus Jingweiarchaeum tengchongense]MCW1305383.1 hypothetical protein [Candidatus Jingweiarchaeum tengchongense]
MGAISYIITGIIFIGSGFLGLLMRVDPDSEACKMLNKMIAAGICPLLADLTLLLSYGTLALGSLFIIIGATKISIDYAKKAAEKTTEKKA